MSFGPTERKIAARLMRLASDEFSNRGCTEFQLENNDENWAFVSEVMKTMGDSEDPRCGRPKGRWIVIDDWLLMRYFAQRLADDRSEERPEQVILEQMTTVTDAHEAPKHLTEMSRKGWMLISVVLRESGKSSDDLFQYFWRKS